MYCEGEEVTVIVLYLEVDSERKGWLTSEWADVISHGWNQSSID